MTSQGKGTRTAKGRLLRAEEAVAGSKVDELEDLKGRKGDSVSAWGLGETGGVSSGAPVWNRLARSGRLNLAPSWRAGFLAATQLDGLAGVVFS